MRAHPAVVVTPAAPSAEFSDLVAAVADGHRVTAIDEQGDAVRAFFVDAVSRDAAAAALAVAFPDARVETHDVPDEDWGARSQAGLKSIRAGAITVAPPWDLPASGLTVVILPSMGFGTGHHATTRLCLLALQAVDPAPASAIDVGTGSGVLAIAAWKLGATRVMAIDNDQDAIDNARENWALNDAGGDGRPPATIRCADLDDAVDLGGPFELVLANLTGATLVRHADALMALAAAGGRLILSGLREEEEADVTRAFGLASWRREAEDGWVCLGLRR